MPDIVKFKSGNKSSLVDEYDNNVLPISAGTVYFAVDSEGKGSIYFDKDATHRILMTTALDTNLADIANKDGIGNVIHTTYIAGIEFDGTTNTAKVTAIMTLGDGSTFSEDLPNAGANSAGIITAGTQTIAGNKTFTGAFTSSGGATFSNSNFNYSGIQAGSENADRVVWFSDNTSRGKPVYDTDFTYNPSTNTLTATNIAGTASRAVADAIGQNIANTYIQNIEFVDGGATIRFTKGSDAYTDLTSPYLLLTGGTVTGAVTFSSSVNIATATIGTLTVTGTATFQGGLTGQLTGNVIGNLNGTAARATADGAGDNIQDTYLRKDGDIMTGGLEIYGQIAGDNRTTGHGLQGGGAYHSAYNNLLLHGDRTTGTSGIVFISDKGGTNLGQPHDKAFIQYHAAGVTTSNIDGTNPDLTTSGDNSKFIIGVSNTETDELWLQTPQAENLKLLVVDDEDVTYYTIPSLLSTTQVANYPLISTTTYGVNTYNTSVTMNGGTVTATTFVGNLSGKATTAGTADVALKDALGTNFTDYIIEWEYLNNGNQIKYTKGDGLETTLNTPWLPLTGGTMTGQIVLASTGYKTNNTSGYSADQYGNFKHQRSTTSDYWSLQSNNATEKFKVYWETGAVTAVGDITAPNFKGVADYARKAYGDTNNIQDTYIAISTISSTPSAHKLTFYDGAGGNETDLSTPYVLLAGDRMTGTLEFSPNIASINWRPDNANYHTTTSYQTSGNEALVFASKNAVTSFIFVNGEDSVTSYGSARWTELTDIGLQIKNNFISIGELIPSGTTPSYRLQVNGTTRLKGKLIVDPSYNSNVLADSFNEGIRINQSANEWATVNFGGATDSISGSVDGLWIVGRRGKVGTTAVNGDYAGTLGDFIIEEQTNDGRGLTLHKNMGGATLYTSKASGAASFVIVNGNENFQNSSYWHAIDANQNSLTPNSDALFWIGKESVSKNKAYFGFHHTGTENNVGTNNNYATIGLYGVDHVLNVFGNGNVAIGTTNLPDSKLEVNGNTEIFGNLSVGGSTTSNYITFKGITGDTVTDGQWSQHDYIGNRKWSTNSEASELFIFKGNDLGSGTSATATSGSGPDRIRMAAAAHVFQTYTSATSGSFETVATSSYLQTKFEIASNVMAAYTPLVLHEYNGWSSITFCDDTNNSNSALNTKSWIMGQNNDNFYLLKGSTATGSSSAFLYHDGDQWVLSSSTDYPVTATVAMAIADKNGYDITETYIRMDLPLDVTSKDSTTGEATAGDDMNLYNAALNYASDALDKTHNTLNLKAAIHAGLIRPSIWGGQAITDSSTLALNKVDKEDPYIYLNYDPNGPDYHAVDENIYNSLVALGWDQDCIVP